MTNFTWHIILNDICYALIKSFDHTDFSYCLLAESLLLLKNVFFSKTKVVVVVFQIGVINVITKQDIDMW